MRARVGDGITASDARDLALRYLGRREYSCFELARRLTQRGARSAIADQVVRQLEREGLVSDERFAEMYSRYRFGKLYGPLKIRAELESRGVASGLISAALARYDDRWDDSIAAWFQKRLPSEWSRREKARLYRSGCSRGFTHDQVMHAMNRIQVGD